MADLYLACGCVVKCVDHPILFRGERASDPPLADHSIFFTGTGMEIFGPASTLRQVDWITIIERRPPRSVGTCGETALEAVDERVVIVDRKTSRTVRQKLFPAPTACPKWVSGATDQTMPNDEDIKRWLCEQRTL